MQVTLNLKSPFVHRHESLDDIDITFTSEDGYDLVEFDLDDVLHRNRLIAHVWSIEDVISVRPDLDDDQCWQVLEHVDHYKDADLGISWQTLEIAAQVLFGFAPDDITTYIQKGE